ncbi:MAG: MerR family transcriptional regulator [Bacillota bacterium]|jgi:DNA-binding transcriptional MerR regulator|nr:MerR family transcriptional regulator [Eubacteriales bacterium]MDI9492846.1 MerR family transcriptional regulator [Bacillota bacterium]NLV70578.1 MerR family transcriptional regulator [Clostridiales bacterium]
MEYTIGKLAKLAGLTTRTLRYYDQIDLLNPSKTADNGYRIYTKRDVDRLQQILFFRVLKISPEVIRGILDYPDYDALSVLETHRAALREQREQLEEILENVEKTIAKMKGEYQMTDQEKFKGLKEKLLEENQEKYGKELMEKYGEKQLKKANERFSSLTQEEFEKAEKLSEAFTEALKGAAACGDPACAEAREACSIHREWLALYWGKSGLTPVTHLNLADMYCSDARFAENMEALAEGRAEFFRKALILYYDL